jgi:hypothetical protein
MAENVGVPVDIAHLRVCPPWGQELPPAETERRHREPISCAGVAHLNAVRGPAYAALAAAFPAVVISSLLSRGSTDSVS